MTVKKYTEEQIIAVLREGEARAYYHEALRVATEMKFRPEIALTRLQLAELLIERYPDDEAAAREHLDFAMVLLWREMGDL